MANESNPLKTQSCGSPSVASIPDVVSLLKWLHITLA